MVASWGGSFLGNVTFWKVYIWKYKGKEPLETLKKPMLNEDYVVNNELAKLKWAKANN